MAAKQRQDADAQLKTGMNKGGECHDCEGAKDIHLFIFRFLYVSYSITEAWQSKDKHKGYCFYIAFMLK